jgi:hypothetical protein
MLVFWTQHCELLHQTSLWFTSTPLSLLSPLPYEVSILYLYTKTVCKGGGGMGFWPQKVTLQVNF